MSTRADSGSRKLAALRRRVDAVDRRIVHLLAARQRLVSGMRPFKTGLRDVRREARVLAAAAREARRRRIDRVFVAEVYRALLGASRAFQKRRT
jgi:chorismate mutase